MFWGERVEGYLKLLCYSSDIFIIIHKGRTLPLSAGHGRVDVTSAGTVVERALILPLGI